MATAPKKKTTRKTGAKLTRKQETSVPRSKKAVRQDASKHVSILVVAFAILCIIFAIAAYWRYA